TLTSGARANRAVEAEENRFGLAELDGIVLTNEPLAEEQAVTRFRVFEDGFARLPIAGFHGIDNPLVKVGRNRNAIRKNPHRLVPVDIEQRFRRGKLEDLAVLPEPVE